MRGTEFINKNNATILCGLNDFNLMNNRKIFIFIGEKYGRINLKYFI